MKQACPKHLYPKIDYSLSNNGEQIILLKNMISPKDTTQKKMKRLPLIIAHRGSSGAVPENTRSSFLQAIKDHADVIEMDIHITKDKQAVVIHDASINRTSDGKGFVHLKTLKQLQRYNYSLPKKGKDNKDSKNSKDNKDGKDNKSIQREEILTLAEALDCIGYRCKMLVELKLSCRGHEHIIMDIIKAFPYSENVWIHTSHRSIIKNVRRLNPTIRVGHILLFTFIQRFLLPSDASFGHKYNVNFYSIEDMFIKKYSRGDLIRKLKGLGKDVSVWTIDDLATAKTALKLGVDGIITNYPGEMVKQLKRSKYG